MRPKNSKRSLLLMKALVNKLTAIDESLSTKLCAKDFDVQLDY